MTTESDQGLGDGVWAPMGTFKEGTNNRKPSISQPGRPSQGGAGGLQIKQHATRQNTPEKVPTSLAANRFANGLGKVANFESPRINFSDAQMPILKEFGAMEGATISI